MSASLDIAARVAEVKRRVDLVGLIGRAVKLRKAGREFEGLCPFHQERTASFTVAPNKGFYHCFGCGAHGDAIRFLQDHDGLGFIAALERLEGDAGILRDEAAVQRASARPARDDSFVDSLTAGRAVWCDSAPSAGSLVETYLRGRGIDLAASGILRVLRFHPRCPVRLWRKWEGPATGETCEAMLVPIGQVVGPAGARRFAQQAVEAVFLTPDGRGKKRFAPLRSGKVPPSRKIWGEAGRGACPVPPPGFAGDWCDLSWIDGDAALPLVVGEGLESTLSLLGRIAAARGAFAAMSLNNLQGGALLERDALPLQNLRADPERPPFLVEDAGTVLLGSDADMKGLKRRRVIDRAHGPVVTRDLTGLERTMICETLASAHWRTAGATRVSVARPPMGADWNDVGRVAA